MYSLKINDFKIENLSVNGNNFVSKTKIDTSSFENKIFNLVLVNGKNETEYQNIKFIQQQKQADGSFFLSFREISAEELRQITLEREITNTQLALVEIYEKMGG